jgi:hypothetical protein
MHFTQIPQVLTTLLSANWQVMEILQQLAPWQLAHLQLLMAQDTAQQEEFTWEQMQEQQSPLEPITIHLSDITPVSITPAALITLLSVRTLECLSLPQASSSLSAMSFTVKA